MIDASTFIPPESLPRCSACDLPVEKLYVDVEGDNNVMIAQCHNKVEVVTLSSAMWEDIVNNSIATDWAPAFAERPKLLTGPDVGP